MRGFIMAAMVLLATGCASDHDMRRTLIILGSVPNSGESFSGTGSERPDGTGNLKVTLNTGVICWGKFTQNRERAGAGDFTCGDGRTGDFTFATVNRLGRGQGTIGGRPLAFTLES